MYDILKKAVLNQDNILFCGNNYRYVSHINQIASCGFKTKNSLIRNTDIIRFDKDTLKTMQDRYIDLFNKEI